MRREVRRLGVVILIMLVALLMWQRGWTFGVAESIAYAVESGQARAARSQLQSNTNLEQAFELAAEAIRPSVVSITSTRTVRAPDMPGLDQFPFEQFFGRDNPFERHFRQEPQQRTFRQQGLGSGVIVSNDGYILTNNHVVDDAQQLTVQLSDNRQFPGKVVGRDAKTDIAVVKIDADNLTPAELGDSDSTKVGQWVMAAGSPFGLKETVSAGIISATGRSGMGIEDYEDFLQTDAAINPGNSGGPLIDLKGEVIGINTAIVSRSGGFQGVGFAIPASMAKNVMDQLIKNGKVTRAWLGVVIQELTPKLAASFGYKGDHGVLVAEASPNSPAAKAGLKSGDIILAMNGKAVSDVGAFRNQIAQSKPGTKEQLEVWRDGKSQGITVALEEMPAQVAASGGAGHGPVDVEGLGLQLADPTPQVAQQFHLKPNAAGAVVAAVEPGSPAQQAGLQPGDLIVQVQGQKVASAADAEAALSQADLKQGVRLRVRHGNMERYVVLSAES